MTSMFRSRILVCVVLALLSLAVRAQNTPDNSTHRLILKDGSYQIVTKYEVKGDRVRYYSSEREEWEEIPNSLVDWPATDKYEKDRATNAAAPEAVQLDKELEHESEVAEARLPEVAPGLRIPEGSGVFMLDNFQGEAQIVELHQAEGDINRETKGNIFRGALNPVAGMKATIELDGIHAAIQSHVDVPSIYLNIDAPDATQAESQPSDDHSKQPAVQDRYRIVRMDIKGNKRILGDIKRQVTGKVSQEQHFVKTTLTQLAGGWLKLTPSETLAPGEYAVVEVMGKEGMNLYVYDFGMNPKAPGNANPWKADGKPGTPK